MRRRPLLAALAVVPVLIGLAGCGFTPLYATGGMAGGLSTIDVQTGEGRTAYLLHEQLDDALAHDRTAAPVDRLVVTIKEKRVPRGLGADNAASRYELTLQIDYTLSDIATGKSLKTGTQNVLVSYKSVTDPYAGVVAQQDSQERAAQEAAQRIRIDLAEYFLKSKS